MPLLTLRDYLQTTVRAGASDLFITVAAPPVVKVQGSFKALPRTPLSADDTKALAYSAMRAEQVLEFETTLECDMSLELAEVGRFRVNVFMQRGAVALVARYITFDIPDLARLGLPPVLGDIALFKRGLVLVCGPAGAGKSTSLAAMLGHRNAQAQGHILTVEDPIEFVHTHRKSLVNQREVGIDTLSFDDALRHAMREAPDVIMIGEIRDRLTMQHAMAYADTGHLCMSTLHANSANQAVQRVIHFFPQDVRHQVLLDLSLNLRAVIGQRLITNVEGRLVPALEVMQVTPYIADLILKGQIDEIKTVMHKGRDQGMCTFDDSLFNLYEAGQITREQAIDYADSKTDVSVRIRLTGGEPEVS
ncbi:MAG: PilT/PilU family type 4a pilus ATPase [Xylophilus sp.]|nr:PilT/PilU family type 4a pilus ATPase [Xylophilus sp.]